MASGVSVNRCTKQIQGCKWAWGVCGMEDAKGWEGEKMTAHSRKCHRRQQRREWCRKCQENPWILLLVLLSSLYYKIVLRNTAWEGWRYQGGWLRACTELALLSVSGERRKATCSWSLPLYKYISIQQESRLIMSIATCTASDQCWPHHKSPESHPILHSSVLICHPRYVF